ncbi:hypothetical protein HYX58_00070 [Candidatus Dependentiae bacterium]|nr:hypothetical protein [Candidatus Dependentiae bacterium]
MRTVAIAILCIVLVISGCASQNEARVGEKTTVEHPQKEVVKEDTKPLPKQKIHKQLSKQGTYVLSVWRWCSHPTSIYSY